MLNIAICDDETSALVNLSDNLNTVSKELNIVCDIEKFTSGTQLLKTMETRDKYPDILYMDVHMPKLNGIETVSKLRKLGYNNEIIFNSKSKPEVFEAFDVDAFHYIVKDETSEKKKKEIFLRAYKKVEKQHEDYITVSCAGESKTIPLKRIKYFVVKGNIVEVYFNKNEVFEFYTSLNKIQDTLLEKGFVRISKNVLINLKYIDTYTKTDLQMKDGRKFEMGRVYRKELGALIDTFFQKQKVLNI
ncbi:MAG: LytTR family DNA-binding domain-containing protein [Lachnospiraceae bacterium]|jgi:DNA-binding LytR/AlgR family response regulator|nr:LytTR family DNA-binding domain-containing protein [Lachnospiraceae bacterium]